MLKARKKLTKQELKHDPLLDTMEKGKDYFEENKQQILTGLGAIVVVIALAWLWSNSRVTTNNEAMLANTKATLAANMGMNDEIFAQLEQVVDEYSGNKHVAQATLKLGMANLTEGNYAGARNEFEKLASSSDKQTQIAGKLKLALTAEREGDHATAADLYTEVADSEEGLTGQYARLQSGYAYLANGDVSQARDIAEALLADEPVGNFKESVDYLYGKVLEK